MRRRAALSEVISSIILSGVVLIVGGALWSYSLGATMVIADDYAEGTFNLVDEITERFTVEHVSQSADNLKAYVWVNNYGDVDIVVDLYISVNTGNTGQYLDKAIASGSIEYVEVPMSYALGTDNEITVKVYSRRQNSAYYTYYS